MIPTLLKNVGSHGTINTHEGSHSNNLLLWGDRSNTKYNKVSKLKKHCQSSDLIGVIYITKNLRFIIHYLMTRINVDRKVYFNSILTKE